jgi:hypothetical protein
MSNIFWEVDSSKSQYFKEDIKYWKFVVEREDWERTYFVWKVVYPTLFAFYYHINFHNKIMNFLDIKAYKLKESTLESIKSYYDDSSQVTQIFPKLASIIGTKKSSIWLLSGRKLDIQEQKFINESGEADFRAGGYLTKMLDVILIMQFFLAIPLVFSFWNLLKDMLNESGETKVPIPGDISFPSFLDPKIFFTIHYSGFLIFSILLGALLLFIFYLLHKGAMKIETPNIQTPNIQTPNKGVGYYLLRMRAAIIIVSSLLIILGFAKISNHINYISPEWNNLVLLVVASIGIATTLYISYIMMVRILRRKEILESGFNSIRSSSLLWSIVFKVHYESWDKAQNDIKNDIKTSQALLFDFEERYKIYVFQEMKEVTKNFSPPAPNLSNQNPVNP